MSLRRLDPAVVRLVGFVAALVGFFALLVFARRVFLPLLLGLAAAYLLDPAVSWFERRGRSRAFGTVVVSLVAVVAVIGCLLIVVPLVGSQLGELSDRLPGYREELMARVQPLLERLRTEDPERFETVRAKLVETVRERWPQMAESALSAVGSVFSSVLSFLLFLLDLVFVPVFAFYLLVDFPRLKEGIRLLVPMPYRETVMARLHEVDESVSSFLRGQLTIALVLAAINAVGLTLLGVPMGFLIGIVAGLANLIPYMALVVGLAPALLLAWIEHQSLAVLLGVAAVFTGAQLFEGMVLSPRILSQRVHLHPVWILLSIIVGGRLFGIVGMLVAVPAAATIQIFVRHWLIAYRRSAVYTGDAEATSGASTEGS